MSLARLDAFRDLSRHLPDRDVDREVPALPSRSISPTARLPARRGEDPPPSDIEKRRDLFYGAKVDVPSTTAIAPVGSPFGDVLLPTKARRARPASPAADLDDRLVGKHDRLRRELQSGRASGRERGVTLVTAGARREDDALCR